MRLYSINTGFFKLDGGAMFGVVPKLLWQRTNPADGSNLCTWAIRSLLIEDGGKLILIDTGVGDKQSEKFFNNYHLHGDDSLERSLARHGFHRDDITDVILTHLHFDHVGGAIRNEGGKLTPTFKNATYWSNEKQWQWAVFPNEREKASFLRENIIPIQEKAELKFIEEKQMAPFSKDIHLRFAYGHTEAMMLPIIKYKEKTIVFVTDLLPSLGHLPLPYIMAYDMFPLKTLEEKKTFLQEALDNHYILFFQHDPLYECCNLKQTGKGIRCGEVFSLQEVT